MKDYQKKLAAKWLCNAADLYSCHGCNDYQIGKDLTPDQIENFTLAMREYTRDPEFEVRSGMTMDWIVIGCLGWLLENDVKRTAQEGVVEDMGDEGF